MVNSIGSPSFYVNDCPSVGVVKRDTPRLLCSAQWALFFIGSIYERFQIFNQLQRVSIIFFVAL